jgi:hypothetical protein
MVHYCRIAYLGNIVMLVVMERSLSILVLDRMVCNILLTNRKWVLGIVVGNNHSLSYVDYHNCHRVNYMLHNLGYRIGCNPLYSYHISYNFDN